MINIIGPYKMIEIDLTKMKKGTGTKKSIVRKPGQAPFIQEFASGQKESVKKPAGRTGTGKLDKLPDDIKKEIINLRNLNYSGSQIKDNIETMLETVDSGVRQGLIDANVISDIGSKLTVTPQALTDYAKKHGAKPTKTHGPKTVKNVQAQEKEKHETTKKQLSEADKKIASLEIELQNVKDRIEANRVDAGNKRKVREKLRSDLRLCRAELGQ
jgi:hypothetical protein